MTPCFRQCADKQQQTREGPHFQAGVLLIKMTSIEIIYSKNKQKRSSHQNYSLIFCTLYNRYRGLITNSRGAAPPAPRDLDPLSLLKGVYSRSLYHVPPVLFVREILTEINPPVILLFSHDIQRLHNYNDRNRPRISGKGAAPWGGGGCNFMCIMIMSIMIIPLIHYNFGKHPPPPPPTTHPCSSPFSGLP